MNVFFKQPALHQGGNGGVNHWRRAAQVGLVPAAFIFKIIRNRFMHKAGEARPAVFGFRRIQRRNVAEVRIVFNQLLKQAAVLQLGYIARALKQVNGAGFALFQQV